MSYLTPWLFYAAVAIALLVAANRGTCYGAARAQCLRRSSGPFVWLWVAPLRTVMSDLKAPREWDFVCFWLWGRMELFTLHLSDPAQGIALGRQMGVSDEMVRDISHVGFRYPPPTMLSSRRWGCSR